MPSHSLGNWTKTYHIGNLVPQPEDYRVGNPVGWVRIERRKNEGATYGEKIREAEAQESQA